jgi:hypothetical protein
VEYQQFHARLGRARLSKGKTEHWSFSLRFALSFSPGIGDSKFCLGRAFSLFGETGMTNGQAVTKKKSSIGVKASAAEAGKYTREAGVLAYYEVNIRFFSTSA